MIPVNIRNTRELEVKLSSKFVFGLPGLVGKLDAPSHDHGVLITLSVVKFMNMNGWIA